MKKKKIVLVNLLMGKKKRTKIVFRDILFKHSDEVFIMKLSVLKFIQARVLKKRQTTSVDET